MGARLFSASAINVWCRTAPSKWQCSSTFGIALKNARCAGVISMPVREAGTLPNVSFIFFGTCDSAESMVLGLMVLNNGPEVITERNGQYDKTPGDLFKTPCKQLDDHETQQAARNPCAETIRHQREEDHGKDRESVGEIVEMRVADRAEHRQADQDQRRRGGFLRDRKRDRHEQQHQREHACRSQR